MVSYCDQGPRTGTRLRVAGTVCRTRRLGTRRAALGVRSGGSGNSSQRSRSRRRFRFESCGEFVALAVGHELYHHRERIGEVPTLSDRRARESRGRRFRPRPAGAEAVRLFAGIDGGQSSTVAVVADDAGRILGRGAAGPADEIGASKIRRAYATRYTVRSQQACAQRAASRRDKV